MVIGMMVWFHGLDSSASSAGGIDEFPILPPGPSIAALNPAYQDPEALWHTKKCPSLFAGWRAIPGVNGEWFCCWHPSLLCLEKLVNHNRYLDSKS